MEKNSENQCERIESVLSYVEGEMEPMDSREFETHVAACRTCSSEVNVQKSISNALRNSLAERQLPELPPNFSKRITVVAEGSVKGLRDARERRGFLTVAAVAAVATCALAALQSGALLQALGSFSLRGLGFLSVSLYFLQNLAVGCFRILKAASSQLVPSTPFSALALGVVFLGAAGLFMTIASNGRRADADRP